MTVKKIVAAWLKEHGYDGLRKKNCGCAMDNLFPCNFPGAENCVPAYRHALPCDDCGNQFGCTGSEYYDQRLCECKRKEETENAQGE